MRYISALDMPFDSTVKMKSFFIRILLSLITIFILFTPLPLHAELINTVVAFIDDQAITLRDFKDYYTVAKKFHTDITPEKALETLINRLILLREARRLKLKGSSEDDIINTYIDIKIRAFVRVSEEEINRFYKDNKEKMKDIPLQEVRQQIENLLIEKKVNNLLKIHLRKLKKKSYIKINSTPGL